jgi:hypothetical protein
MSYFLTSSNDLEYFKTHPPILAINNFINSNSNFISEFHSAQNYNSLLAEDIGAMRQKDKSRVRIKQTISSRLRKVIYQIQYSLQSFEKNSVKIVGPSGGSA